MKACCFFNFYNLNWKGDHRIPESIFTLAGYKKVFGWCFLKDFGIKREFSFNYVLYKSAVMGKEGTISVNYKISCVLPLNRHHYKDFAVGDWENRFGFSFCV